MGLVSRLIRWELWAGLWTLTPGWGWRLEGQASGPQAGGAEIPLILMPGELPRACVWEAGADRGAIWTQSCLRFHLQRGGVAGLRFPGPQFPSV